MYTVQALANIPIIIVIIIIAIIIWGALWPHGLFHICASEHWMSTNALIVELAQNPFIFFGDYSLILD